MSKRQLCVNPFGRRSFLRGAAGITLGLPFLEATAQTGAAPPKRLLLLSSWQGSYWGNHNPSGTEDSDSFKLGAIMKPLEPYQKNLIVVSWLDNPAATLAGHFSPNASLLTGRTAWGDLLAGEEGSTVPSASGESIDQFIGARIGKSTQRKSVFMLFGGGEGSESAFLFLSPTSPGGRAARQVSVGKAAMLKALSAGGGTSSGTPPATDQELVRLLRARKSAIDAVESNYALLKKQLGKTDRDLLDSHLTTRRELELRMIGKNADAGTYLPPQLPKLMDSSEVPTIMAHALASDFTRVGAIAIGGGYPFKDFHAEYIHKQGLPNRPPRNDVEANARAGITQAKVIECQRVVKVIEALKAVKEGNGTLFDNTLILWFDEFVFNHHWKASTYVLLSGSNRFFPRMGRFLSYPNERAKDAVDETFKQTRASTHATNHLLNSIVQAMGVSGSFGDPQWGTGTLPRLF